MIVSANDFKKYNTSLNVIEGEPMSRHTSFKVGGAARFFISPSSKEQLIDVILACKEEGIEYTVIGRGSNLIVSDEGYDGMIICLGDGFSFIMKEDGDIERSVKEDGDIERSVKEDGGYTYITASAGAGLISLSSQVRREGLAGLEFACGIPGSVGGAIYMNAGAHGGQMSDVVSRVTVIDRQGRAKKLSAEEMNFGYRHSAAMDEGYVVVDATFKLSNGDKDEMEKTVKENLSRRKQSQPLEYPSAGSVFKRPEGTFAGKLIEDAGLKGFSIGGAEVSDKHAGFIVNKGDATAADVVAVIEHVTKVVLEKFGVKLEPEVRFLGKF